jgi:hypothetical protein
MMSNLNANIKFKFVELISKTLAERPMDNFSVPPTEFNFDILAESRVNAEQKLVIIKTNVSIKDVHRNTLVATIGTVCVFEVQNFQEIFKLVEDNKYYIPPEIDVLLKSVSISTTRGVIFSEFRGTYLLNATLPIIILQPSEAQPTEAKVEALETK